MSTAQKIIKYFAIALAIFIIINIIYGILIGINSLAGVLGLNKKDEGVVQLGNLKEIKIEDTEINDLKIELAYSTLNIKIGNNFKVETNSSNIECDQEKGKLTIKEKKINWLKNNDASSLVIYIPDDSILKNINIKTGAGKINIEKLQSEQLSFEIGAGEVLIENINIISNAKINGGAGKVEIRNADIKNMDLDIGVGEFKLQSKLSGNNTINAGIGNVVIDLIDEIENYTIKVDKGIGNISIDGRKISNDTEYGSGNTHIKIDGGIGNINIQ